MEKDSRAAGDILRDGTLDQVGPQGGSTELPGGGISHVGPHRDSVAQPPSSPAAQPTIHRDGPCIVVHVPMVFRRRGGRKEIVVPGEGAEDEAASHRRQPATLPLVMAVVRGHVWRDLLESGRAQTIAEIARANRIDGSYVSRMIDLTLLAPDIILAILDGNEPSGLSLARLTGTQIPPTWDEQRRALGFVPTV